MTVEYTLTPHLRIKLKEPFGDLIEGSVDQTMAKMKALIAETKPPMIISVGDVVSLNLHNYGIHPQVTIVDNVSLRDQVMPKQAAVEKTLYVENPQGTITRQAESAIKCAIASGAHTHIVVEGEEDLLTLVAVLYAPQNGLVVYGQPHCGIVVVLASKEKKEEAKGFLNEMKASKS
jgi:uncharacterized protein (UPF0218 family)